MLTPVHRGQRRHAIEEEQLVRGEAHHRAHPGVERGERAVEMRSEAPVQVAAPAQRAVHDLGAQPRVAGVEVRALERRLEREIGEGAVPLDANQDVERLVPRLGDRSRLEHRAHGTGSLTRAPAARRAPRRKSAHGIALRFSGWTSRGTSRPSAVAMARDPSPCPLPRGERGRGEGTRVPGGAVTPGAGSAAARQSRMRPALSGARGRPRVAATHAVDEIARGLRRPQPAVFLLEPRGERGLRVSCGIRAAVSMPSSAAARAARRSPPVARRARRPFPRWGRSASPRSGACRRWSSPGPSGRW